jgi:tetratricopeptide (TPR) repeat protein
MHNETLRTALDFHQRGQLDQAAQLYQQILASDPKHADALQLLGLACLQRGDTHNAIDLISRAIAVMPQVAAFHANLAEAYRFARQFKLAANCCSAALRLKPDYPEAFNSLGLIELDQGHAAEAARHFQDALKLKPDFALAHNNLGNAYRLLGDIPQAIACFARAVELSNNLAMAHSNLCQLLLEKKMLAEALHHAQAAVQLEPGSAPAHNNLGNVFREMGRLADAKACYTAALRLGPHLAMVHNNIAQILEEENQLDDAVQWYQQAINLEPNTARFHANLAGALREKHDLERADASYQTALRLEPKYAEARAGLGWLEHQQGHAEQARAHYEEALRLKPDLAQAHCNLGELLEELNELPAAEVHLREAIRHDPRGAGARAQLANMLRAKLPEPELDAMHQLAADPLLSDGKRALLLFAMAQVHDARGEHDRAGELLSKANPLEAGWRQQRGHGWDPSLHVRFIEMLQSTFTPELFERANSWGVRSERPVFIVGLPRSGTTLIEQVLASHSQVFGAGELRYVRETFEALAPGGNEPKCLAALETLDRAGAQRLAEAHLQRLDQLDDRAVRIVDKMPDNYMYLGLLSILFPRARFIHCRRDLRDVAVSCWMTHFRQIRWANDGEHIVSRFREYQRIMDHWSQVLPSPVLDIDYEETVEDLEGVARRLLSWCDLEWDPACLEFHRTQRPVRTASVMQVRQPVYKHSVARWKNYEPTLGPLFRQLEAFGSPDDESAPASAPGAIGESEAPLAGAAGS